MPYSLAFLAKGRTSAMGSHLPGVSVPTLGLLGWTLLNDFDIITSANDRTRTATTMPDLAIAL